MFKIHAIGNNQVSMKIFSVCLLLCMGVMCHAQGFEQSTLDEYLYGPYFNDLAIEPLDESAIGTFFNKKTCNEVRLTQLHQAFLNPVHGEMSPATRTFITWWSVPGVVNKTPPI